MIRSLLLSSGMSFILSFTTLVFISRGFELAFVADVKSTTLLIGWISTVISFQIHSAFLFFYGKKGHDNEQLFIFTITSIILLSLLGGFLFFYLVDVFYSSGTLSFSGKIAFSFICVANLFFIVSPSIYVALNRNVSLTKFTFCYLFSVLLSLTISWFFEFDINTHAFIQLAFQILSILLSPWFDFFSRYLKLIKLNSFIWCSNVVTYARNLSMASFLDNISNKVDKFTAVKFTEQSIFAKYSVLSFENPLINVILSSYGVKLLKSYQNGIGRDYDSFVIEWRNSVRVLTFICFPIGMFFFYFSEPVVLFIFGERYIDSLNVFKIYSLVCFVRFAPFQVILRLENLTIINIVISFLFFMTSLLISVSVIFFDMPYEYLAFSYLIGWLIFNLSAIYFSWRYCEVKIVDLICFDICMHRLFLCLVTLVIIVSLNIDALIINITLYGVIYLIMNMVFDKEVRNLILIFIKRPGSDF